MNRPPVLRAAALLAASLAASGAGAATAPSPGLDMPSMQAMPSREIAARQGRYFVFTTGNGGDFSKGGLPVPPGDYLNVYICNISGGSSGIAAKNAYVTERLFDGSGSVSVAYGGVASPAALTAAMTAASPAGTGAGTAAGAAATTYGTNVLAGGAASSIVRMIYGVGTTYINNAAGNATPSGVGYIYPGMKNELHEIRVIPPQTCFGQYMDGLPTALGSTTYYLQFRMYEYEE